MPNKKLRLLVTAGPTREMLDPVRFLSNVSTGYMGYQIAAQAKRVGHEVILISGPTALTPPNGIRFVSVLSAKDMKQAVSRFWTKADALIMTAAVCDYTPVRFSSRKIKRIKQKTIRFKRTADILKSIGKRKDSRVVVGFALETEAIEQNALRKLRGKNLDLIVANWFTPKNNPFGKSRISVILIGQDGSKKLVRNLTKPALSRVLLKEVGRLIASKKG